MKEHSPTICLTMIVKNEARIIERCMDSVRPIIGFVSVCDTGSTDNTPALIQNWCERHGIPGKVHHEPFRNFGYNRTRAVELAQQTFPESRYLLLLDADMTLEIDDRFNQDTLSADIYQVAQYDDFIRYYNIRLLKTSGRWQCVGVTHEYWDCADGEGVQPSKLDTLVINDRDDGGCKSDKFIRDRRLLTEGFSDAATPEFLKTRYSFYLAQTYFDLSEFDTAITWYQERAGRGGWAEEVFYTLYKIGKCYEKKGDAANAVSAYTNAWEYRPSRAEPVYCIAALYRARGKHNSALMYALQGQQIPLPADILFVEYPVCQYLFDFEISISAFYVLGKKPLGKSAWKRLHAMLDKLPRHIADSAVEENERFYQ
jgi:glycosyltransferase involved in cell wall biosynthesis